MLKMTNSVIKITRSVHEGILKTKFVAHVHMINDTLSQKYHQYKLYDNIPFRPGKVRLIFSYTTVC